MRHPVLLILFLSLAVSCAPGEKPKGEDSPDESIDNPDGTKTLRSYYRNKKIKSEATYRGNSREGLAKSYDEAGNLLLEINYVNDRREGLARRFYIGGAVFQTTEYKNNVMHGKQFKFKSNGNPISEANFEKDYPCLGLKEYRDDKSLRTKYPEMVIKEINKIKSTGKYTLEVSMTGNVKKVKYYTGKLTASGCVSDNNSNVLLDEARHTGIISYHLMPREFMMEELNIVAVAETLNGNSYVCQKTFHVSIKN
jgi:hypothetical protein